MAEEQTGDAELSGSADLTVSGEIADRLWDANSLTLAAVIYSLLAAIAMYLTSGCEIWVRSVVSAVAVLGLMLPLVWRPARNAVIKGTRSLLRNV